ncbi:hypothetical protein PHLGIDRAFT_297206 [Phlebiopsis gigantea 11061_1 CR5-6]|uniref:Uncharacterized protein n=1 Tax=Phlebiopsis gigantea (strain 11061_1 CR5-6) TaxID=745531 RepID=A0A0C3PBR0_PHLG1|nr:hypothetical protein PHLGIDRAFT_297206 [Phlebiopsis gigantea 11061_1 CR5-6]
MPLTRGSRMLRPISPFSYLIYARSCHRILVTFTCLLLCSAKCANTYFSDRTDGSNCAMRSAHILLRTRKKRSSSVSYPCL